MAESENIVRVLGRADMPQAQALLRADPVTNVFAHYRARMTNMEPRCLGGEFWGRFEDAQLTSMCHVAANLVPVNASAEACADFAARARRLRPDFATIVGPQGQVRTLWEDLVGHFPAPREIRWEQPHLVINTDSAVAPDPGVRRTAAREIETLYPACVAMYTEEVGVSPEGHGGRNLYRARVTQLVNRGWSFSRIDDGEVVFKAEVACTSPYAAQVQGVYVAPAHRGKGIASRGMAAVVEQVRADIAPAVSLYVNAHNVAARATYKSVGFEQTATFATIMF